MGWTSFHLNIATVAFSKYELGFLSIPWTWIWSFYEQLFFHRGERFCTDCGSQHSRMQRFLMGTSALVSFTVLIKARSKICGFPLLWKTQQCCCRWLTKWWSPGRGIIPYALLLSPAKRREYKTILEKEFWAVLLQTFLLSGPILSAWFPLPVSLH